MGVGLGLFMGAMGGDTSAIEVIKGKEVSERARAEQSRHDTILSEPSVVPTVRRTD
jgi:hypothetical protein